MGDCIYCKKSAGWFRSRHSECEAAHKLKLAKHAASIQGLVAITSSYVQGTATRDAFIRQTQDLAKTGGIQPPEMRTGFVKAWEETVKAIVAERIPTGVEEQRLMTLAEEMNLSQDDLNDKGAWKNLTMAAVLRDVTERKLKTRMEFPPDLPFNFKQGEKMVWLRAPCNYYEDKMRREYVGGSQGVSMRVAKGVYYRTSGYRGHTVETQQREFVESGILGITTMHIYFTGPVKTFRIPYSKVVSFLAADDGFGLNRDAVSAKPQYFVTGDGWFYYNLLSNLAAWSAEG